MAVTKLTDIVTKEVEQYLGSYLSEQSIYKSALVRSGLMEVSPELGNGLSQSGRTMNIPFWQYPTASNGRVPTEGTDITADNITSDEMIAPRLLYEMAHGANAISNIHAGEDPLGAIQAYLSDVWNKTMQDYLVSIVKGVIADNDANDSDDMFNDITTTGSVGADHKIDTEAIIDTYSLLGDASDFSAIAMHSTPYFQLVKNNLIDFTPDNEQDIGFGTFMGMTVIRDDNMPTPTVTNKQYWSVLFKRGAFLYAESDRGLVTFETERNPKQGGGVDTIYTRRQWIMHPLGFAYSDPGIGTIAVSPTATNLEEAARWDRVFNLKNVGFVVLKTNG